MGSPDEAGSNPVAAGPTVGPAAAADPSASGTEATAGVPAQNGTGGNASLSRYLAAFHVVSAGLNGAALGSDEQDIVFIAVIVIDAVENKVRREEKCIRRV